MLHAKMACVECAVGYEKTVRSLARKYGFHMKRLAARVRRQIIADGVPATVPVDCTDDEPCWSFAVRTSATAAEDDPDALDVRFVVGVSMERDGTDEGIAFMVELSTFGGALVGQAGPQHNHTAQLWCRDRAELQNRWATFESVAENHDELLSLWRRHLAGRPQPRDHKVATTEPQTIPLTTPNPTPTDD